MVVLGLAIQVAPLAIAPLVLKLSGGVLGKFAGIVNDKNRGLLDRTRNFARDWSKQIASKRSLGKQDHELGKKNFLRRAGRNIHYRQRRFKEATQNAEGAVEAAYEGSRFHAKEDRRRRDIEQNKTLAQKRLDVAWNEHVRGDEAASARDLRIRTANDQATLRQTQLDNRYEELKTGRMPIDLHTTSEVSAIMTDAKIATERLAAEALRKSNAQRVMNSQFSKSLLESSELQRVAGGIHEHGKNAAIATAVSTMRSEYAKSVEEGKQILSHFNLSSDERQAHARGETVTKTDSNGTTYTFDTNSVFTRESAIEQQYAVGTVEQIVELMTHPGMAEFRTTAAPALAASSVKNKAFFMGGKLVDDLGKGAVTSKEEFTAYVQEAMAEGKFKDIELSQLDPQALKIIKDSLEGEVILKRKPDEATADYERRQAERAAKIAEAKTKMATAAARIKKTPELSQNVIDKSSNLWDEIIKSWS